MTCVTACFPACFGEDSETDDDDITGMFLPLPPSSTRPSERAIMPTGLPVARTHIAPAAKTTVTCTTQHRCHSLTAMAHPPDSTCSSHRQQLQSDNIHRQQLQSSPGQTPTTPCPTKSPCAVRRGIRKEVSDGLPSTSHLTLTPTRRYPPSQDPPIYSLPMNVLSIITQYSGRTSREVSKLFNHAYGPLAGGMRPYRMPDTPSLNKALMHPQRLISVTTIDFSAVSSRVMDPTLSLLPFFAPRLRGLILRNCPNITPSGFSLLSPLAHSLQHLDLTQCHCNCPGLLSSVTPLTSLQSLRVDDLPNLWSEQEVDSLQRLQRLTLLQVLRMNQGFYNGHRQRSRTGRYHDADVDLVFRTLGALTCLKRLDFIVHKSGEGDALRAAQMAHLRPLRALTHLSIEHPFLENVLDDNLLSALPRALPQVVHLSLPTTHYFSTNLHHISDLPHLASLHIAVASHMSAVVFPVVASLSTLQHLTILFPDNIILDNVLAPLTRLAPSLHSLRLTFLSTGGWLSPVGQQHVAALTNLRRLAFCGWHDWDAAAWYSCARSLTRLEDLEISECWGDYNRPSAWDSEWLSPLTALTRLSLQNIAFMSAKKTYELMVAVSELAALRALDIRCSYNMRDANLAQLSGLTRLRELRLERFPLVNGVALSSLPVGVVSLSVDGCNVTDDSLKRMAHMSRLTRLKLGSATLTGSGLTALRRLAGLEEVEFGHCVKLGDEGLLRLAPVPSNLQRVVVTGLTVSEAGLERLRRSWDG